jgi:hypothetical protein
MNYLQSFKNNILCLSVVPNFRLEGKNPPLSTPTQQHKVSINVEINVYLKFYNTLIFSVLKVLPFGEDLGGAIYSLKELKKSYLTK